MNGDTTDRSRAGEPWGPRLWLSLAAVVVVAACLQSYGIRSWPMADDEVPSLVEMHLFDVPAQAFSVPADQIGKLPRILPVWYKFQRFTIDLLPRGELSYRLPSVVLGILTSALAFLLAARWRGLWFASALAIVLNGSQTFIYLVQLDRFYSLPLLLTTVTLALMWIPWGRIAPLVAIAVLTLLCALSHNITVPLFALTFIASCAAYIIGRVPSTLVVRSGVAALVSVLVYFIYLVPLVSGWNSTGNPTPVLVSFVAHAGIPTIALAVLGGWISLVRPGEGRLMIWWTLVFVGSLCLLQVTHISWNPRYFLFFLPAAWLLAAHAMASVARSLNYRSVGLAWYGCVALLLLPNLLSHFQDGSRHDYRQAAAVLQQHVQDQPILSDDAETISYYLPPTLRANLYVRTKVKEMPASAFYLVARSNAWMPQPVIGRRRIDLVAEIYRRRFDQFSHILRVYRVAANGEP
jgi:hypothetical protein